MSQCNDYQIRYMSQRLSFKEDLFGQPKKLSEVLWNIEKICADLLANATCSYLRCSAVIVENVGIQRLVPFRVLAVQHHHTLRSSIPGDRPLKVGDGDDGGGDGDSDGGGDGDGDGDDGGNGCDFADDS